MVPGYRSASARSASPTVAPSTVTSDSPSVWARSTGGTLIVGMGGKPSGSTWSAASSVAGGQVEPDLLGGHLVGIVRAGAGEKVERPALPSNHPPARRREDDRRQVRAYGVPVEELGEAEIVAGLVPGDPRVVGLVRRRGDGPAGHRDAAMRRAALLLP